MFRTILFVLTSVSTLLISSITFAGGCGPSDLADSEDYAAFVAKRVKSGDLPPVASVEAEVFMYDMQYCAGVMPLATYCQVKNVKLTRAKNLYKSMFASGVASGHDVHAQKLILKESIELRAICN